MAVAEANGLRDPRCGYRGGYELDRSYPPDYPVPGNDDAGIGL